MIQACLNGARRRGEHPALPLTTEQLGRDAAAVVAAGARSLHVHPRERDGAETLDPACVGDVIEEIAMAVPGVELSLSTGLWITGGDAGRRRRLIEAWDVLPDLVSLNVGEEGWEELGELLLEREVGIEIGLTTPEAAEAFAAGPLARRVKRVLVEVEPDDGDAAVAVAEAIDGVLDDGRVAAPRLHHGVEAATWAVIAAALPLGHDVRVGLEDVLVLPDGSPAPDNAALVAAVAAL
jgi:uncharacterized protein (DUF849 family)